MAGDQGMQTLTFLFAFIAVLALIGVAAWLVRRFATNRLGANPNRGRMPRLAVIDAAAVDGRRRLVLVRRDNVEHLLMIGGPTDIVVEPNIVRATPARDQMPRPAAVAGGEPPRIAPLPDAAWSDGDGQGRFEADMFDHAEPPLAEPPRPARPSFADELRRPAAPPPPERRIDPLAGFTPEPPGGRAEPLSPRLARPEPMIPPRPPRASEPAQAPRVRASAPNAPPRRRRPTADAAADAAAVHRRPESRRDGAAAGGSAPPPGRRNGRAAGCARNAGRPPPAQRDSPPPPAPPQERL